MINPEVIKWARQRANFSLDAVKNISPKYKEWEEGKSQPNLKQLEKISKKLYCPFGYFFLSIPPEVKLPITDFRTIANRGMANPPSINLLETIYDAQRKKNWLREQKIKDKEDKLIAKTNYTEQEIITKIKKLLNIENLRKNAKTYEDFLRELIENLDEKDFLVIRNGIVGHNTHRPLDIEEFKGFSLFDEYAPVIFINGKDSKASQIFTLIHELVHLFLNESALDGTYHLQTEQKCNQLAAEILLPKENLKDFQLKKIEDIAKQFKVSVFVVLIRAKQLGFIEEKIFQEQWEIYKAKVKIPTGSGGNFYQNVKFKAGGENFLLRVIRSTLAGETLYREAYSLTGLKATTFDKYYREQNIIL